MTISRSLLSRRTTLGLFGGAIMTPVLPAYAAGGPQITIHKDPNCGCCSAWANHLKGAGFEVNIVETSNLSPIKQRLGVPDDLASCHTAEVAGYIIEGHVPASAVLRLLEQKPQVTGLAVPGMPAGSPGMEGGTPEVYDVVLFGPQGRQTFARFQGSREL